MLKSFFLISLSCLVMAIEIMPQSSKPSELSNYSYRPPTEDKNSWQRLNLLLSATFFRVVKEGELDFDSCLLYASRSLGLSRFSMLAEGIDDPELLKQSNWIDRRDPAEGLHNLSQVKGKKRVELLLLLGAYYTFQPRINYNSDSVQYFLSQVIREARILNEKHLERQAICLLGKMYFEIKNFKSGDSVFARLIQECETTGDKATEARAYVYRALFPDYTPATSQNRIDYFQRAAALYHELNKPEDEINALTDAGYMLVTTFQLQKAKDFFLKALQLAEAIKYPYTHYNTDALAMVNMFDGKFGEPLKYTFQTIKTAETTKDSIGWGYFYSRLGTLYYIEGGREEESLKWSLKALDHFLNVRDAALFPNLYNIVGVLGNQGRCTEALDLLSTISKKIPPQHPQDKISYNLTYGTAYKCLKQYKVAEEFAMKADSILKGSVTLRGAYQRSIINLLFGSIYLEEGKFEKSKKFLDQYLSVPTGARLLMNEIQTYRRLIIIDSALGNTASAINNYKLYIQLLDSNFRVSKIRQAEELQVIYLTEEKENKIALLNQQSKLEQAKLREATLFRNVTIAGILGVLIIAGLLYRQSRLRKKHNVVITHKNEQLQHFLNEKEWLLKEIHHRVKNNLQIVMSLLNSQTAYIENESALTAIHDSQHRVHAMSLIHQKLYGSENVSSIDMSFYIRELVSYLADSFGTGQRIRFEYNIEPLKMDVSQAVPLGLILNEAFTNAIKYAFPNGRNGLITISLSSTSSNHYILNISDNGVGIIDQPGGKRTGSLGMSLMAGLAEDLDGTFTMENDNGTRIKITFVRNLGIKSSERSGSSLVTSNSDR